MVNEKEVFGFGLMRLPQTDADDPASIDMEEFTKMVDYYMDHGFNYYDTSYAYHNGKSEGAFKEAVTDRYPRESFRIIDKLPTWALTCEEDNQKYLDEMMERLGVEYFDKLFIHNINEAWWPLAEKAKTFDFLEKMKEEGITKEIGFSLHAKPEVLKSVLEKHPIFDFVQLQLNYLDWNYPQMRVNELYEIAVEHGLDVLVMEPLKGGALINLPEDAAAMLKERDPDSSIASWGLRFAASLDAVKIVNSGMNRMSDMIDNVETFTDFKPLSEEEFEFLEEVSKTVRSKIAVACSYCKYCVEHCPNEIPIPDYFGMYNSDKQATNNTNFFNYGILSQVHGKASDCTECGACLEFCTQSLDIPKYMKDVAEYFEKEE